MRTKPVTKIQNIFLTIILSIIIASCAGQSGDNAEQSTLPPPVVRIIKSSVALPVTGSGTSTPPSPTETVVTLEDPQPSPSATYVALDTLFSSSSEPTIVTDNPPANPQMVIGSESHKLDFQELGDLYQDSGIQIVRYNGLLWHKIEPNAGNRMWDEVSDLEQELIAASENGLEVILIVRGTPDWAQEVPGSFCGPIRQDQLAAFAAFMSETVERYSIPPYNVKYWELGNEPDVDPTLVKAKSVFGCWGDKKETYYGGEHYADMLKEVYPAIKAVDPDANVLVGGLLLDCDPTESNNCQAGRFLEGIFRNGGGEYFDVVSYHGYAPYSGQSSGVGALYLDEHLPKWEHRGGVVLGKLDYLRELMLRFGIDKPIFHTEGALTCPEYLPSDCNPPENAFYNPQADYVVWLFVRNWANGIKGTIWYQFEGPGWRFGGLLDDDQNPKPAFEAMHFLTEELSGAQYSGKVTDYENLEGYGFILNDKLIWVLWSTDEIDTKIQLPGNTSVVYNKFGEDITPDSAIITINNPVYIELAP